MHFIVEASWLHSSSNYSVGIQGPGSEDSIFQKLKSLHSELSIRSLDANRMYTCRSWLSTDRPWSVPSYDLVWGAGHSYGGSSIIVDKEYEERTVKQSLESFKLHVDKKTGKCSDCVVVFHRIGEKLRNKIATKGSTSPADPRHSELHMTVQQDLDSESFNPFRKNGSLWVEIDCGHFYPQRDSWPTCSAFIDESQRAFDRIVPKNHKSHYPNVPNLVTEDWREQYYGREGYERLQKVKQMWDPENVFRHSQSVSVHIGDSAGGNHSTAVVVGVNSNRRSGIKTILSRLKNSTFSDKFNNNETDAALLDNCIAMYDRSAMSDLRNRFDVTRFCSKLARKLSWFREALDSRN